MTAEYIFTALGVSLVLTLLLELLVSVIFKIKGRDLIIVCLANVVTNPVVVLCYLLVQRFLPEVTILITLLLELAAVATEAVIYFKYRRIHHPVRFAIFANLFSYSVGVIINAI